MATNAYDPKTRIFESDLLESMTRTHPAWPAVFWVPVTVMSLGYALREGTGIGVALGLFLLGTLAWTLVEYWLHRIVFHYIPKSPAIRRFYYLVHQVHHDQEEWDRLTAPVPLAMVIATPILAVLFLTLGPVLMWAFFAGFVVGYLAYDYIHFYTHFGKPKSRIGKGLRRRHQQHHHAYHERWFGVSSPLWDYVFGTAVKRGERPCPMDKNVDWGRPNFTA